MDYKIYFIDAAGHISGYVDLIAESDDEATTAAEAYRDGKDLELWQRDRCVKKIPKLS